MGRVELKKISRLYGDHRVLEDIDLEVQEGEFLVILGASGGGKTTLLNLIAGLVPPSSGRIFFDGTDVTETDVTGRNVAFVFQDYALYPHMNVRQNIRFPLENQKMDRGEAQRKVEEVVKMLRLERVQDKFPAQLSGGQKQRVAIGRALVRDPFVFLFDEPMSSLDQQLQDHLRVEIKQLHRKLNRTFIYVTHDQLSAMILGQRIAFLAEGRIQQIASPQELYLRPRNVEVARFLGFPPINLFTPENFKLLTSLEVPEATAQVGVRPEHFRLKPEETGARILDWVQKVGYAEYGCFSVADSSVCAQSDGAPLSGGQRVSCHVDADRILYFDRDGNRIP